MIMGFPLRRLPVSARPIWRLMSATTPRYTPSPRTKSRGRMGHGRYGGGIWNTRPEDEIRTWIEELRAENAARDADD